MKNSNWMWSALLLAGLLAPAEARAQAPDSAVAAPAALPQQVVSPPAPAATTRRVRRSWTADSKPLLVGDVITILIDEHTLATADLAELRDKDRDRDLDFSLGLAGSLTRGRVSLLNDASERTRGEAARRERFTAEITARVLEIGPGGVAQIEGVKRLQIDDHEQAITLRGWIRAEDVSVLNTVESWRVANAEVLYESNGELQNAPAGILGKIFEFIW
jgi:flagellar basal body L-ring protein FlgH